MNAHTRSPTSIDQHVGARLRLRRSLLEMSQAELGERLGVTFQQVQKYERGANRIGASRLFQVAKALGVPVGYFYEGLDDEGGLTDGQPEALYDFITSPDGMDLAKAFQAVESQPVRRQLITLMREMAS